ncbi:MAG TPA: ATP-binding protein, partial [Candidatus Sulfotelmatobacter sp.]|nr:ATP-binding protein [Candidatus Sulfotelmatobacter sp.]
QEALQLSQHQLAEAMDLAQLANWEYDVATGLYTFDDRFFSLYATSIEREGGQQMSPQTYVREFLYPEDAPFVFKELEQAVAATDPHYAVQLEHRIRRRDGETRHLLVRVAIAKDAAGQTIKVRGVNQDITERKRLERQLVEISDREQARIGQDLHDGLCQQLVSLGFDANGLESQLAAKSQPEVATARRIALFLDHAITEARQLSRGLFPIRLAAHGLPSALEELASTTRDRFRIPCRFVNQRPVALPGEALATHLFRIAQEAVTNALKHAQPKGILIELCVRATTLELRVEDDGIGISEPPQSRTGMGLHIMDYRARSIGGTLGVAPGARGGTTVTCSLPLPPGAA